MLKGKTLLIASVFIKKQLALIKELVQSYQGILSKQGVFEVLIKEMIPMMK